MFFDGDDFGNKVDMPHAFFHAAAFFAARHAIAQHIIELGIESMDAVAIGFVGLAEAIVARLRDEHGEFLHGNLDEDLARTGM